VYGRHEPVYHIFTAPRSVQPFLQAHNHDRATDRQTDRQTDHTTPSVTICHISRIYWTVLYVRSTALRTNNTEHECPDVPE